MVFFPEKSFRRQYGSGKNGEVGRGNEKPHDPEDAKISGWTDTSDAAINGFIDTTPIQDPRAFLETEISPDGMETLHNAIIENLKIPTFDAEATEIEQALRSEQRPKKRVILLQRLSELKEAGRMPMSGDTTVELLEDNLHRLEHILKQIQETGRKFNFERYTKSIKMLQLKLDEIEAQRIKKKISKIIEQKKQQGGDLTRLGPEDRQKLNALTNLSNELAQISTDPGAHIHSRIKGIDRNFPPPIPPTNQ